MPELFPLIIIEGGDAAGKATQTELLLQWLKQKNQQASKRSYPNYESHTGKLIKGHLKSEWCTAELEQNLLLARKHSQDELMFQCLMTVNRYEDLNDLQAARVLGPVICDRYWSSGLVYGAINGVDSKFLDEVHSALPKPDACILIDLPVAESFKRRSERRDRYETQVTMLERVRAEYLRVFRGNGWQVVDGIGDTEMVQHRIRRAVHESVHKTYRCGVLP